MSTLVRYVIWSHARRERELSFLYCYLWRPQKTVILAWQRRVRKSPNLFEVINGCPLKLDQQYSESIILSRVSQTKLSRVCSIMTSRKCSDPLFLCHTYCVWFYCLRVSLVTRFLGPDSNSRPLWPPPVNPLCCTLALLYNYSYQFVARHVYVKS